MRLLQVRLLQYPITLGLHHPHSRHHLESTHDVNRRLGGRQLVGHNPARSLLLLLLLPSSLLLLLRPERRNGVPLQCAA
jgi:hypothetical protein